MVKSPQQLLVLHWQYFSLSFCCFEAYCQFFFSRLTEKWLYTRIFKHVYGSQSIYKSWWWTHSVQLANTLLTSLIHSTFSFFLSTWCVISLLVILSRWATRSYNIPLQKSHLNSISDTVAFCGCVLAQWHTVVCSLLHYFESLWCKIQMNTTWSFSIKFIRSRVTLEWIYIYNIYT